MIVALAGGVGGAKLADGLARVVAPGDLTIAVNTGDDFEHLGLHVSPDLDTVMYTLAGRNDRETGWGLAGETWAFMAALERLGGETWFRLGDQDMATHVERTRRLGDGQTLSAVTAELCDRFGIGHPIVPMSDDPIRTMVLTGDGRLPFQDYFVRLRCEPRVTGFEFDGAQAARASPALLAVMGSGSISTAIICPSNPYVSVGPILAVPEIARWLGERAFPVTSGQDDGRARRRGFRACRRAPLRQPPRRDGDRCCRRIPRADDRGRGPPRRGHGNGHELGRRPRRTGRSRGTIRQDVGGETVKLRAIIPVKSFREGKGRLSAVLGGAERNALNVELLDHMLSVTAAFPGAAQTIVVSPDRDVLDRAEAAGAQALLDVAGDLNAALDHAACHAADHGADGILIVPVDLPRSRPGDLLALVSCRHGFAIAPDRRGIGTNALFVSPPDALPFRFGDHSFLAHLAEAREAGLNTEILSLPNLAFDIDTPDDYREWRRQDAMTPVNGM